MKSSVSGNLLLIEKVLILKSANIFRETPENILAEVAQIMDEIEYEEDAEIFKEDTIGDCMYIVHKGSVRIHKANKTLAILYEKEVFGELSLLDTETRSAGAFANTDCSLFKIEQEPFFELLDSRPVIDNGLLKMFCKRLRILNEKFDKQKMG